MIIATRPEPTVLPPSRTLVPEIVVLSCDFQGIFGGFLFDTHLVTEVLQIYVIMVLSRSEVRLLRFQCVFTQKTHLGRIEIHLYELPNHCLGNSILIILL